MAVLWNTPAGLIDTLSDLTTYRYTLSAVDTFGGPMEYTLIAGSLPDGMSFADGGLVVLYGNVNAVIGTSTSTFVIRATSNAGVIADRTFSFIVNGAGEPSILPDTSQLGVFDSTTFANIQIELKNINSTTPTEYTLVNGELPRQLTLSNTGTISGYITPGYSDNYDFTVQAKNGNVTVLKLYSIATLDAAQPTANLTADGTSLPDPFSVNLTSDLGSVVGYPFSFTADETQLIYPTYSPILYTPSGSIGTAIQDTNFAFQLDAHDYNGKELTYELVSGYLPPGFRLNSTNGWITGFVPLGSITEFSYTFTAKVYETLYPVNQSDTKTYTINIAVDVNNQVIWDTAANIGEICNGSISNFSVSAHTVSNRTLTYKLKTPGAMPYGLELLSDGTISGRVSFNMGTHYLGNTNVSLNDTIDSTVIDIDSTLITVDSTVYSSSFIATTVGAKTLFTFTVSATDAYGYAYGEKTFTITVDNCNPSPYENLYIQLLPNRDQRNYYENIVNNTDLIPWEYLYRPNDPWFGLNKLRRILFLSGVNVEQTVSYLQPMSFNHYWKQLNFGKVKSAIAQDENFNTIYEVVYIEILEDNVNSQGLGPAANIALNPNTIGVNSAYPNTFADMANNISGRFGFESTDSTPLWMVSQQPDGTVLGFTRALVLCYCLPGKSAEIAYRINQTNTKFNLIDFKVDRYELDSLLSRYYNKQNNEFIASYDSGQGTITCSHFGNTVSYIATDIIGNGTISGTKGSLTIHGTNSNFDSQLRVGANLYANTAGIITSINLGTIVEITNANLLTVINPLPVTISNLNYHIESIPTAFTTDLHVGDEILVNNLSVGIVKTITNDSQLVLADNASFDVTHQPYTHTARDPYSIPEQGDKYLKFPNVRVISSNYTIPEY